MKNRNPLKAGYKRYPHGKIFVENLNGFLPGYGFFRLPVSRLYYSSFPVSPSG
ncbi:MAG: hypothetical protein LBR26_16265 [Prevotella sp.]|jgi:hypothetical protein|nr:hypothetical protein [Prevotella sp.]